MTHDDALGAVDTTLDGTEMVDVIGADPRETGADPRETGADSLRLTAGCPRTADRLTTVSADREAAVTRVVIWSADERSGLNVTPLGCVSAAIRRLITGRLATGSDIAGLLTGSLAAVVLPRVSTSVNGTDDTVDEPGIGESTTPAGSTVGDNRRPDRTVPVARPVAGRRRIGSV